MKITYFLIGILFLSLTAATKAPAPDDVSVIAFGSCNKPDKKQKIWKQIRKNDPDVWLWLGDAIYADTEDMAVMSAMYNEQLGKKKYQEFIDSILVNGIWDDHDYGENNAGKEYPKKAESRDLFYKFLGIPSDDERWQHEGAYGSQLYDFGGNNRTVNAIFLDARYFRDEPMCVKKWKKKCDRNMTGTILGEEQWRWLEEELKNSTAELTLICTGIQVLPIDHEHEKWGNFPNERKRLLDLIARYQKGKTIILSGDRHFAELSGMPTADSSTESEYDHLSKHLFEMTSSGMTHSWEDAKGKNRYRVGEMQTARNFGVLKIDWNARRITIEARGTENEVLLEHSIGF